MASCSAQGNLILRNKQEGKPIVAVVTGLPPDGQCYVITPFADPVVISSEYQNPTGCVKFFDTSEFASSPSEALHQCPLNWQNKKPFFTKYVDLTSTQSDVTLTYPDFMQDESSNC